MIINPYIEFGGAVSPLNMQTAGLQALYGIARQRGYTGPCCRVKRSSDNTELDIGFATMTGLVDLVAANVFRGSGTLSVVKAYDMSGNGRDATMASPGTTYLSSSTVVRDIPSISLYLGSFDVPASVSIDRQSCTIFMVEGATYTPPNTNLSFGLWGMGADFIAGIALLGVMNWQLLSAADSFRGLSAQPTVDAQISVLTCSPSAKTVNCDEALQAALPASAAGAMAGGHVGYASPGAPDTGQYKYVGNLYMWAAYNTVLTQPAIQVEKNKLYPVFDIATNLTKQVVNDGDSITAGVGSILGVNRPFQTRPLLNQRVIYRNKGLPGAGFSDGVATAALFNAGLAKNLLVAHWGANDILGGVSAATLTTRLATYVTATRAAGFDVFIGTVLPSTAYDGTMETVRTTYNDNVRSGAVAGGYTVADYANIPEMMNPANPTYYADGIHPTSPGYATMSQLEAPLLNAAL